MTKQMIEKGIVPELANIDSLPLTYKTQPIFNVSGGNANLAHKTPDGDALSLFEVWVEGVGASPVVQVDLCVGNAGGELEAIPLQFLQMRYVLPFERQLSSFVSGTADRYAFKVHYENVTVEYYGENGLVANPTTSFPTGAAIYTNNSLIGEVPVDKDTEITDLFGIMPPSPYYNGVGSVYGMLSRVAEEFDDAAGHDHDGTNSKKVSHASLVTVGEDDHHNKMHGATEHTGYIGGLSQISDVHITAVDLDKLDDGVNTALHFHDSDRDLSNATGSLVESKVAFDNIAGHDHDGTNSKKVSHASLVTVGEDDHHNKMHGATEHTGSIGILSQISDVHITAVDLDKLDDGVNTALHFHDSDRDLSNATGSLVESKVAFDNIAGHAHDGSDAKKVNPADLESCPDVTSTKLNSLCSGATIAPTVHKHDKLTARVMKFGYAPEYANAVFDNSGISSSSGVWLSGYDSTVGHTFMSWSSALVNLQSYRLRVAVKLPSDFAAWATNPFRFWHREEGVATDFSIGVTMTLPNGTLTTLTPSISNSIGAWGEYVVSSISGTYAADDWFVVTFEVGAKNSAAVKLGRMEFAYLTDGAV